MAFRHATKLHREACRLLLAGPLPRQELAERVMCYVPLAQAIRLARYRAAWLRAYRGAGGLPRREDLARLEQAGRAGKFREWLENHKRGGSIMETDGIVTLTVEGRTRALKELER